MNWIINYVENMYIGIVCNVWLIFKYLIQDKMPY